MSGTLTPARTSHRKGEPAESGDLDDCALETAAASSLAELEDPTDAPDVRYDPQEDDEAIDAPDDMTPGDDA